MILPQELEVYYVIPALRKELANSLIYKGLKQKQIASLFGVSEACISNYSKEKRGINIKFNKNFQELINKYANKLINENECFTKIVNKLCNEFRKQKCLCNLHKKLDPSVKECGGCIL